MKGVFRGPAMNSLALYLGQAVLIFAVIWIGFDLGHHRSEVPLVAEGDALDFLAVARAFLDGDSLAAIHRLGSPPGLAMVLFPFCGMFEFALIKFFTLFVHSPGAAVNDVYYFSFIFTGLSACWCLRRLDFRPTVAFTVGTLYAFLPWAFFRNITHLLLVYYFVPFVATTAVLMWSGTLERLSARHRAWLFAGTCLTGLNYIYTAFFSCFLVGFAGCAHSVRTRTWHGLRLASARIGLIAFLAGASLVPSLLAWRQDAIARDNIMGQKLMEDSEMYALKLRLLLSPRWQHPIPALARFAERTVGKFPYDNENISGQLGMSASIGLIFLLLMVCVRFATKDSEPKNFPVEASAALALAAILLGTMGGFGSLISSLVSSQIRAYNRISIFIAFFALIGFSHLLTLLLRRWRPPVALALCTAVLFLGVWDQASFATLNRDYADSAEIYDEGVHLVRQIEATVPKHSIIYQLPYVVFPFHVAEMGMTECAHFLPFICSRDLQWSWPALTGRSLAFNARLGTFGPDALGRYLPSIGYAGVWIDRRGYLDAGASLIAGLEARLGTHHIDSDRRTYAFLPIHPAPGTSLIEQADGGLPDLSRFPNLEWGETADFTTAGRDEQYLGNGWSVDNPGFRWSVGTRSVLHFTFAHRPVRDVRLTAIATALLSSHHPKLEVSVKANGYSLGGWVFGDGQSPAPFVHSIPAAAFDRGPALELTFDIVDPASPRMQGISSDDRLLGIALRSVQFQPQ